MDDTLQFYPTPKALAKRMWDKFTDRDFRRVLEPSAGAGDLLKGAPFFCDDDDGGWLRRSGRRGGEKVDCIEADLSRHPSLREMGCNVVGMDFLAYEGGAIYSHVIMNPPFSEGAAHVLKAWDALWDGEIVALLNAETVRNPFSRDRQRLAALIEEHGEVEFIEDAFKGEDVVREAQVDVALVHLVKPATCNDDWIGPVIESMTVDRNREEKWELPRELALPTDYVSTQVHAFRLAVKAMREAVKAEAVSSHYALRIGATMADLTNRRGESKTPPTGEGIRAAMETRYLDLKDRAWASVLRSTETLTKLSAKVQKQAEAQFEEIKKMEFTASNVYGFLLGLVQSAPEMQMDMMCDVFDEITRYHSDNTVFYKGWKSNDAHQTCGRRIKTTRFVLPNNRCYYSGGLEWGALQRLADFDKVFAMLDGKPAPAVSLVSVLGERMSSEAKNAKRLTTSYFDIRYYKGVGTLHFYPRSKELIDRLNRLVGQRRAWLPPATETVPEAFWLQYDRAEKFDAEFRKEVLTVAKQNFKGSYFSRWDDPINRLMADGAEGKESARAAMNQAMDEVLKRHGLLAAIAHADPVLALPAPGAAGATAANDEHADSRAMEAAA